MKNHHHNNPIHPKPPSHEAIAERAFMLWLEQGQPENCHESNWFEAEKQLTGRPARSTAEFAAEEPTAQRAAS